MYCVQARPSCLLLLVQLACRAFSRALANTGNRIAARIAMMAMTTSNSISVNALRFGTMDSSATAIGRCRSIRQGAVLHGVAQRTSRAAMISRFILDPRCADRGGRPQKQRGRPATGALEDSL